MKLRPSRGEGSKAEGRWQKSKKEERGEGKSLSFKRCSFRQPLASGCSPYSGAPNMLKLLPLQLCGRKMSSLRLAFAFEEWDVS